MSYNSRQDFLTLMRKMSKKGFYDIFNYVNDQKNVHYNDVLRYTVNNKIVESRVSVTIILKGLTSLGLLERIVTNIRPKRTNYQVSKKGHQVIKILKDLEYAYLDA